MVGGGPRGLPRESLEQRRRSTGSRAGIRLTVQEVATGGAARGVAGLPYRDGPRRSHARHRPALEDMDRLPLVTPFTSVTSTIENYAIGYLLHPYVSLYTGRGCRSKCTFCLWPQTVAATGIGCGARARRGGDGPWRGLFPAVSEFFFDDDTFTDDLPRPRHRAAPRAARHHVVVNAKANVPRRTLEVMRDNGLRLLLVGYESGSQQILNHVEGRAPRRRAASRGTRRHSASRSTARSSWAARRDARDDRRDHPLRARDRSRHDPGLPRRAVPRDRALPAGPGARLAPRSTVPDW